jgi:hypothetical protein
MTMANSIHYIPLRKDDRPYTEAINGLRYLKALVCYRHDTYINIAPITVHGNEIRGGFIGIDPEAARSLAIALVKMANVIEGRTS